ncbi:MAG: LIC_10190 family membrane protein [Candidatus Aminicenantes bacterium]
MSELIQAMCGVLAAWFTCCLLFIGMGLLISRFMEQRIHQGEDLLLCFWLGFAFALLFLQLWHLWFPVGRAVFLPLSAMGIAGLFWNRRELLAVWRKNSFQKWLFLSVLFLLAIWMSNRAVGSGRLYDTGLYHLNSVHWAKAFPVVPGLGNLHGRLAFNSSYFLYGALLDTGPVPLKSQHLAAGILLLILMAHTILSGIKLTARRVPFRSYYLFNILLFTPIVIRVWSRHVSSLSPDLAVFTLGIVISSLLLALLEKAKSSSRKIEFRIFLIIILSCLGITIKLSFFVFALSASLVALFLYFFQSKRRIASRNHKVLVSVAVFSAFLLLPWMARGIILSGYCFYPSTIGSFAVDWRIPKSAVVEEVNWIRSWARMPNVHWSEVLRNWDWLKPWASRMGKNFEMVCPLALILAACFLLFYLRLNRKDGQRPSRRNWAFLLPALTSIFYWFFTAPDIRFVGASLWVLAAGTVILLLCRLMGSKKTIGFLLSFLIFFSWLIHEKISIQKELFKSKIYPLQRVKLDKFVTHSGLIIYVPKKGDQCWNGPLLSTPFPKKSLKLRRKGKIRKGFINKDGSIF